MMLAALLLIARSFIPPRINALVSFNTFDTAATGKGMQKFSASFVGSGSLCKYIYLINDVIDRFIN
jgi:4-hydroxybenzoate polyprenyltransferase